MDLAGVSIIIPVRDRSALLMQALEACVIQTVAPAEILVINDRSTESIADAVQQIRGRNPAASITVHDNEGAGPNAARNTGMRKSRGRWLLFLDSDDSLSPTCLEERLAALEGSDLDFGVFPCRLFRKQPGDVIGTWNRPSDRDPLLRFLTLDIPWQTGSALWRKSAIASLAWQEDLPSWQDWNFYVRALLHGLTFQQWEVGECYWRLTRESSIGRASMQLEHLLPRGYATLSLREEAARRGRLARDIDRAFRGLVFQHCMQLAQSGATSDAIKFLRDPRTRHALRFHYLFAIVFVAGHCLPRGHHRIRAFLHSVLPAYLYPQYPGHFRAWEPVSFAETADRNAPSKAVRPSIR